MKSFLKNKIKSILGMGGWKGNYSSWQSAVQDSNGYDEAGILEKQIQAQRTVIAKKAAFERDTVLFSEPEFNFPLLSSLFYAASGSHSEALTVLDFGGALGSTYFQNRKGFEPISKNLKWLIVEQAHFVSAGKKEFETAELKFFLDMNEAKKAHPPQVLLSSSVLPYLDTPYEWLRKMVALDIPYLLFDRIGFNAQSGDRLTVQTVPPSIYTASYPCWFLDEKKFLSEIEPKYELVWDFYNTDVANIPSYYKGFFFRKKGL